MVNPFRIVEEFNADGHGKAALECAVERLVLEGLKEEKAAKEAREQAKVLETLRVQNTVMEVVRVALGQELLTALQASVKTTPKPGIAYEVHVTLRYKGDAFGLVAQVEVFKGSEIKFGAYYVNGINVDDLQQAYGEVLQTLMFIEHNKQTR